MKNLKIGLKFKNIFLNLFQNRNVINNKSRKHLSFRLLFCEKYMKSPRNGLF